MTKSDHRTGTESGEAAPELIEDGPTPLEAVVTAVVPGPVESHGYPVYPMKEPLPKRTNFNPAFLCVVYMKFETNHVLTARYGYLAAAGLGDEATVKNTAVWALEALSQNNASIFHEGRIYRDLEFISVGQQLVMVLFLDNDPTFIKFEDSKDLDYVVRFSKLSGSLPANPSPSIEKNNAFFNLMKFPVTGLVGKEACRLDYWDTDANGDLSDPTPSQTAKHRRYSMNIHFRMAIATLTLQPSGRWIPLVLDPDTGNMGGGP